MKLEIELTKKEAQEILGNAIKNALAGTASAGLEVSEIEWSAYGHNVTVTLQKPESQATEQAA